jgi:type IV pilus assembly protein PilC
MALLIGSKTPLIKAVQLVREMIGFFPYQRDLKQIEEDLLQGGLLHESMSRSSIFDRRVISLVKVGEEINQLDDIFEKLYKQYNEELEHRIGMLSNLLEPVMILFVGILVAIILIAMYLPLFQMSTSFY